MVTRSKKQKSYIDWQFQELQPFVLTEPRWYEKTQSYTIRTISHPAFTELREEFYPEGKKILPAKLIEYLKNPLVLAVWFMDDGNCVMRNGNLRGFHLNTQSFSEDENTMLTSLLREVYGVRFCLEKNHTYHRIGVWEKESRQLFRRIIEPYIIPSLHYKLGTISNSLSPVETGARHNF